MRRTVFSFALLFFLFTFASPLHAYGATSSTTASSAPIFSQTYQLWDVGPGIQSLQEFLNAQGFLLAQSGPGSPGEETVLLGLRTYHALIKYQTAHDLPQTGYFGPQTLSAVNVSA